MDGLACPSSFCNPRSPASFSFTGRRQPVFEFECCDVPEQWLEDGEGLDTLWGGATGGDELEASGGSASAGNDDQSGKPPPLPAPKRRRGRKPGQRGNSPVISHVEAERRRRDMLNRRFCELRAAVPTVSRMDKASLLADAAAYIAELRDRVQLLEAEAKQQAPSTAADVTTAAAAHPWGGLDEKLEVRMVGLEAAALRLTTTTTAARHAPSRLMVALCSLDLPVQHACVCRVAGMAVLDAVVDVPAALRDERRLRAALLQMLRGMS